MDWNRCNICRTRGGLLNETHSHFLCDERKKRGNPTPKLIQAKESNIERKKRIANGIRELFKLSDSMTMR